MFLLDIPFYRTRLHPKNLSSRPEPIIAKAMIRAVEGSAVVTPPRRVARALSPAKVPILNLARVARVSPGLRDPGPDPKTEAPQRDARVEYSRSPG